MELAIVLVVVGLLIGGVLAARTMITASQINAFVRQMTQYDAAMGNFKNKFEALPGDNDIFGLEVGTELHGDGIIADNTNGRANYSGEIGRYWYDISQTGLESDNIIGYTNAADGSTGFQRGINLPKVHIGAYTSVYVDNDNSGAGNNNYYRISENTLGSNADGITRRESIIGQEAMSIDAKMDNNNSATGLVRSDNTGSPCSMTVTPCSMNVRMGYAAGALN